MKIFGKELTFNGFKIYHAGDKPTPSDIGAAASGHTHDELYYTETEMDKKLSDKADASHGTHVTWATSAPKANGTASVGTVARVAREDHVHPLQTTVSGNAGSATVISKRIRIKSSTSADAQKYIKFGTVTLPNAYSAFTGYLIFNPGETSAGTSGILHLHIRNGANNTSTTCNMKWISLENSKYEKTVFVVKVSNGVFDLYYKPINNWDTMEIIVIAGSDHGSLALANSGTYISSITAFSSSSIGGYTASAASAAKDGNGNDIVSTYATKDELTDAQGVKVYVSTTQPAGTITKGSIWL